MNKNQAVPWENMLPGTQRRVEHEATYDYFWIVDYNRRYGFFMKLNISEKINTDISLRGIDLLFEKNDPEFLDIFFFLEDKSEAEVFRVLCFDLIFAIDGHDSDVIKVSKLLDRIEKWKNLLANKRTISFSIEQQMGIYSELCCLKNIIAKSKGYEYAIKSWVGMDKDKQDFSLEDCVIEVKSHRTTKGNFAYISSVTQLYTEKDKFFLVSYGMTINEQGKSIDDLLDDINLEISGELKELLLIKIFETGWIPYHDKLNKEKFVVDSEKIYKVNDKFPKINNEDLDFRITDIKYKIDLSKCNDTICYIKDIFGGE